MNKEEVKRMIESSENLSDFLENNCGCVDINVYGTSVKIFKAEIGVEYYYRCPYSSRADYAAIGEFMRYAIPILSALVEKEREKRLWGPDCIPPSSHII